MIGFAPATRTRPWAWIGVVAFDFGLSPCAARCALPRPPVRLARSPLSLGAYSFLFPRPRPVSLSRWRIHCRRVFPLPLSRDSRCPRRPPFFVEGGGLPPAALAARCPALRYALLRSLACVFLRGNRALYASALTRLALPANAGCRHRLMNQLAFFAVDSSGLPRSLRQVQTLTPKAKSMIGQRTPMIRKLETNAGQNATPSATIRKQSGAVANAAAPITKPRNSTVSAFFGMLD